MNPDLPIAHGLYDPRFEHDACGVSFVANIKGVRSREIVTLGITALCNMEHRGATGAEADTGDGAGILIQVPDAFLRAVAGFELPAMGKYAVGIAFLPADPVRTATAIETVERIVVEEGLRPLGWRVVPSNPDCLGASARAVMPAIQQFFLDDPAGAEGIDLDRKIFVARKRIERELVGDMRIATSLTTVKSTRCRETETGCVLAKRCWQATRFMVLNAHSQFAHQE